VIHRRSFLTVCSAAAAALVGKPLAETTSVADEIRLPDPQEEDRDWRDVLKEAQLNLVPPLIIYGINHQPVIYNKETGEFRENHLDPDVLGPDWCRQLHDWHCIWTDPTLEINDQEEFKPALDEALDSVCNAAMGFTENDGVGYWKCITSPTVVTHNMESQDGVKYYMYLHIGKKMPTHVQWEKEQCDPRRLRVYQARQDWYNSGHAGEPDVEWYYQYGIDDDGELLPTKIVPADYDQIAEAMAIQLSVLPQAARIRELRRLKRENRTMYTFVTEKLKNIIQERYA